MTNAKLSRTGPIFADSREFRLDSCAELVLFRCAEELASGRDESPFARDLGHGAVSGDDLAPRQTAGEVRDVVAVAVVSLPTASDRDRSAE